MNRRSFLKTAVTAMFMGAALTMPKRELEIVDDPEWDVDYLAYTFNSLPPSGPLDGWELVEGPIHIYTSDGFHDRIG